MALTIQEGLFLRLFPPPKYLRLPALGVDLSDHSIRYVEFGEKNNKRIIKRYGQVPIPDGVVTSGDIKDKAKLTEILKNFAEKNNVRFVRCSLPEEKAYLFKIDVPTLSAEETRDNIAFQLEENVPIKAADAIFDYVFLPDRGDGSSVREVVVLVFPRTVIKEYMDIYASASITPLSFEMEAHAIARALIREDDLSCYMIVDFGMERTGLSIVERGVVQFTSTVEVGGILLTDAIQRQFNVSREEADRIKREESFVGHGAHQEFFSTLMNSISALSDEINKHYVYWHTHGDRKGRKPAQIQKIILCGGDANLGGLVEHLSLTLKTRVEIGNVWTNVFSEDEIPDIPFDASLSYTTAIGLALRAL